MPSCLSKTTSVLPLSWCKIYCLCLESSLEQELQLVRKAGWLPFTSGGRAGIISLDAAFSRFSCAPARLETRAEVDESCPRLSATLLLWLISYRSLGPRVGVIRFLRLDLDF